jgi:hypothetical protein
MPGSRRRRKAGGKSAPKPENAPRRVMEREDERMWEVIVSSSRKISKAEAFRRYMAGWDDLPSRGVEDAGGSYDVEQLCLHRPPVSRFLLSPNFRLEHRNKIFSLQ